MKKLLTLFILLTTLFVSAQTNPKFVKLTQHDIQFLEQTYNWKGEKLLILNFKMPRKSCPHNQYKNLKNAKKWWDKFYENVDLTNAANRFVYSDAEKAKAIIDNKVHFIDHDGFIYNDFFENEQSCFGLVVVDKSGNFEYKSGEYTATDVTNFIVKLINGK